MSLFGYPATVTHFHSGKDDWGFPLPPTSADKKAKVVEEQQMILNGKGEQVQIAYEIHLEGANAVDFDDYFVYTNSLGTEIRIECAHFEVKKFLGTEVVKKVVIFGKPKSI
jgi:hypothetical protein